jgi:hypothetical protein
VLLVTDFMNLKIKPAQFFRCDHKYSIYVYTYIYRGECSYLYKYLYLRYVSYKNIFGNAGPRPTSFLIRDRVSTKEAELPSCAVAAGNRTESGTAEASSQPPVRMGEDDMLTDSTSRFGRPWIAAGP